MISLEQQLKNDLDILSGLILNGFIVLLLKLALYSNVILLDWQRPDEWELGNINGFRKKIDTKLFLSIYLSYELECFKLNQYYVKYKFNSNVRCKSILVDILKRVYKKLMAITYWKTFLRYNRTVDLHRWAKNRLW